MNKQTNEQAFNLLLRLVEQFPGLLDGEEPVNGADLVDCLSSLLSDRPELKEELS